VAAAGGRPIEVVDRALARWGFPVGPFQLLDEVGLDVAEKSGRIMLEAFGPRMPAAPALRRVLESGRLGRKAKQGFYAYGDDGKRAGVDRTVYGAAGVAEPPKHPPRDPHAPAVTEQEIVQRCVYPMLDEAVRCLEDEILRAPRDGDVGAVFGIGYPPFRGGPFRTLDALGVASVVAALEAFAARPGAEAARFTPCETLRRMARTGERFYVRGGG
jgi:3-hydroxyacyl-CoA dehydrogenase/enoyl-CoA hydratase/3-hydroxybutyryl-CoA epimerase